LNTQETKAKEIILLVSEAFKALYEDDIEALAEIKLSIKEEVESLEFEDLQFKDEMVDHMMAAMASDGNKTSREETQAIILRLFVKFIDVSSRACTSLLAYTMKDIIHSYARKAFNDESN
jgi:hypothetical protein